MKDETDRVEEVPDRPAELRWFPLRFAEERLEREFRADYARRFLLQTRVSLCLAAAIYALFGLLDRYIMPEARHLAWLIRYCIVCPLILLCLGLSFVPRLRARIEHAWPPIGIAAWFSIICMTLRESLLGQSLFHLYYEYAGLMIVCTFAYTFTRLHFVPAVCLCAGIVAGYAAAAVWTRAPAPILLNNVFFLLVTNVIGMFASYWTERSVRVDFLQQRLIRRQARDLRRALSEVKVLSGLLPICAQCKKVRDDKGYWSQSEEYLSKHSDASLTHGICPECEALVLGAMPGPR